MVSSFLTKFISLTSSHELNKHSGIKTMLVIKFFFCLWFLLVLADYDYPFIPSSWIICYSFYLKK